MTCSVSARASIKPLFCINNPALGAASEDLALPRRGSSPWRVHGQIDALPTRCVPIWQWQCYFDATRVGKASKNNIWHQFWENKVEQ